LSQAVQLELWLLLSGSRSVFGAVKRPIASMLMTICKWHIGIEGKGSRDRHRQKDGNCK
jgi:hypothetical protein